MCEYLRQHFSLRSNFRKKIERTEFLSQGHLRLQDIFVFPTIAPHSTSGNEPEEHLVADENELTKSAYILVHGERLSGKTALCHHLFLRLVDQSSPVLYVDLERIRRTTPRRNFQENYTQQFHGDYALWNKEKNKTVILDNLTGASIAHLESAMEHFDRIIVTLSTDMFHAYYRDDDRLAKFKEFSILPLSHRKQENLIRKRLQLSGSEKPVLHSHIDAIENRINEVIINNRVLPRYPFYILSILQAREGFMPIICQSRHTGTAIIFSSLRTFLNPEYRSPMMR